jgi:hypothetical protein
VNVPSKFGELFNPYRLFTGLFVPTGVAECRNLHQGAKLAYGALLRFAGRDGICFPSMQALGATLGVSSRQARSYVAALERAQLVRRMKRYDEGGQTSNGFEFLWHDLLSASLKKPSEAPRSDPSVSPRNDSSAEESKTKENHSEEKKNDLDCLPLNRKNRDSPSGVRAPSVCHPYPKVRERLARYMQLPGDEIEYPSDRMVVDILDAAGTYDEEEVITALNYLHDQRGLKAFSKHGPNSFAWFKVVLQDYFTKKRERESAANPSGYHEWQGRNQAPLSKEQFEAMTDAF